MGVKSESQKVWKWEPNGLRVMFMSLREGVQGVYPIG